MKALYITVAMTLCLFLGACSDKHGAPAEGKEPRETGAKGSSAGKTSEKSANEDKESSEHREVAGEQGGNRPVEVSLAAQRRANVVVKLASATPLAEILTLTGTVQAIDSRIGRVRPLARGRVTEVSVRLGDRVKAGQVLARFDNIEAGDLASQYHAAQAELARLRIQQAVTARQAERSRNLVAIGAVPQKELEAIEAERQGQLEAIRAQESTLAGFSARLNRFGINENAAGSSSMTSIVAPFGGVITAVQAAPGEVVDTSAELFAIADLSRVYVAGQVYEKDLGRVSVGQSVTITVASYPDLRFPGRVASISAILDPQTRTASVRCDVANPGERLRLDMFATVELPTATHRDALALPLDAVQRIEGKTVVFVKQDATHFRVRPVQLGRSVGDVVEITRGIAPGDPVVISGAFPLKSALLGKDLAEEKE
jgi:cobalt-zinc-cadmium efflux system membrane fusion protein